MFPEDYFHLIKFRLDRKNDIFQHKLFLKFSCVYEIKYKLSLNEYFSHFDSFGTKLLFSFEKVWFNGYNRSQPYNLFVPKINIWCWYWNPFTNVEVKRERVLFQIFEYCLINDFIKIFCYKLLLFCSLCVILRHTFINC